ncbi:MAG: hypothetical protein J5I81_05310 [Nitrococcus mobilis]|nr:hypothetical protein [Nitrococcus mobilis]
MHRTFWKNLHRWLDTAGKDEIEAARLRVEQEMRRYRDADVRREFSRAIRLMDEEMSARSDLARLVAARASQPL